ncbi:MAG: prephenate dehydrogenase/arogenate dehydrogenase family protein [Candidatus Caenarcaniphilales bacterium]|nr:prephenate dehydrogenase/arogenate dehydrogenase family protein [Candidatus Caenarcaniphilales bacterium]
MSQKDKIIGIIGLGLIGGSLALKLIEQNYKVYGFVRDLNSFKTSYKASKSVSLEIEDKFAKITDRMQELSECDLVFVCSPLRALVETLKEIQPFLKPGAVVSDVGSVKSVICEESKKFFRKDCFFVGGHPMAGTEKSGFANAFPELFESKTWALIEDKEMPADKVVFLEETIQSTGAKVIKTNAQSHDQAVAMISHLPLLLSLGLLETVNSTPDKELKELALSLASSGFDGMTRLARGNQTLNEDLLGLNFEQVKKCYQDFSERSEELLKEYSLD